MARSLSWIDEVELAEQLKRAGVSVTERSESVVDVRGPVLGIDEITRPPLDEPATADLRIPASVRSAAEPRKHGAVANLDEATGPIPDIDEPLPSEPSPGTGTEPAWPVRRPVTADFHPPIDDSELTQAPDDAEEKAMPGPEDATPLPASFGVGGFGPMASGAADVGPPVAEHDASEEVSGIGIDDETPMPPGLQAAINSLTQARHAVGLPPEQEPASDAAAGVDAEAGVEEDPAASGEHGPSPSEEPAGIEVEPEVEPALAAPAAEARFEVSLDEVDLGGTESLEAVPDEAVPDSEDAEADVETADEEPPESGEPPESPFERAEGEHEPQPFESRPPTGRALARIQLRTSPRPLPVEEGAGESADFSRRSTRVSGSGSGKARAGSVRMAALGDQVLEKFQALIQLLVDKTGSRGAYLADEHGVAVASVNTTESEVALSVGLREALRPVRLLFDNPEDRAVTLELAESEHLHVVWLETALGLLAVGLYSTRVLGGDLAPAVRRMLNRLVGELMGPASAPTPEPAPEPEPARRSAVGVLVEQLLNETDDADRALRRVALRTGLSIDQIRRPDDLTDVALEGLEQAVRDVIGATE